jgi:hypothetical protein
LFGCGGFRKIYKKVSESASATESYAQVLTSIALCCSSIEPSCGHLQEKLDYNVWDGSHALTFRYAQFGTAVPEGIAEGNLLMRWIEKAWRI